MNIIDALNWRYSVKAFSETKLTKWQLDELLEATRLSPSSYGLQPYKIIVIESASLRERLLPFAYDQQQVLRCSHLLVFAARTDIGVHMATEYVEQATKNNDTPIESLTNYAVMVEDAIKAMGKAERLQWAQQQVFVALGNMLTSAAIMKIDSCPIGGFIPEEFDRILGLKDKNLASTVLCPIGFRAPQDKQSKRKKVRIEQHQLIWEV